MSTRRKQTLFWIPGNPQKSKDYNLDKDGQWLCKPESSWKLRADACGQTTHMTVTWKFCGKHSSNMLWQSTKYRKFKTLCTIILPINRISQLMTFLPKFTRRRGLQRVLHVKVQRLWTSSTTCRRWMSIRLTHLKDQIQVRLALILWHQARGWPPLTSSTSRQTKWHHPLPHFHRHHPVWNQRKLVGSGRAKPSGWVFPNRVPYTLCMVARLVKHGQYPVGDSTIQAKDRLLYDQGKTSMRKFGDGRRCGYVTSNKSYVPTLFYFSCWLSSWRRWFLVEGRWWNIRPGLATDKVDNHLRYGSCLLSSSSWSVDRYGWYIYHKDTGKHCHRSQQRSWLRHQERMDDSFWNGSTSTKWRMCCQSQSRWDIAKVSITQQNWSDIRDLYALVLRKSPSKLFPKSLSFLVPSLQIFIRAGWIPSWQLPLNLEIHINIQQILMMVLIFIGSIRVWIRCNPQRLSQTNDTVSHEKERKLLLLLLLLFLLLLKSRCCWNPKGQQLNFLQAPQKLLMFWKFPRVSGRGGVVLPRGPTGHPFGLLTTWSTEGGAKDDGHSMQHLFRTLDLELKMFPEFCESWLIGNMTQKVSFLFVFFCHKVPDFGGG